jgi:hypothetical protein
VHLVKDNASQLKPVLFGRNAIKMMTTIAIPALNTAAGMSTEIMETGLMKIAMAKLMKIVIASQDTESSVVAASKESVITAQCFVAPMKYGGNVLKG